MFQFLIGKVQHAEELEEVIEVLFQFLIGKVQHLP